MPSRSLRVGHATDPASHVREEQQVYQGLVEPGGHGISHELAVSLQRFGVLVDIP